MKIGDFKSYRSAELRLAPLTVLIGANASGKSNAIEALRLLSWVAQGDQFGSIRYAVYDQAIRGTVASLGFQRCGKLALIALGIDGAFQPGAAGKAGQRLVSCRCAPCCLFRLWGRLFSSAEAQGTAEFADEKRSFCGLCAAVPCVSALESRRIEHPA